jgi:hypothetical protein
MSQPQWISLYVPGAEPASLADTVKSALASAGAHQYDPFGTMPGLSYPRAVKLFVAPKMGGWVRLIVSPDCVLEPVVTAASLDAPLAAGFISGDLIPTLTFYRGGQLVDASWSNCDTRRPALPASAAFPAAHCPLICARCPADCQPSRSSA